MASGRVYYSYADFETPIFSKPILLAPLKFHALIQSYNMPFFIYNNEQNTNLSPNTKISTVSPFSVQFSVLAKIIDIMVQVLW